MTENNLDDVTRFDSLQEFVDFFDENDISELASQLPEVEIEVDIKRSRHLVSVDGRLMNQLIETAKKQQVPVERLVDAWLKEKLLKVG